MREFEEKGWFWHWGLKMYKYRWIVTGVWLLLFLVSTIFAQKLPDRLKDSGLNPKGSESDYGFTLSQKQLGTAPSTVNIVYTSSRLDLARNQEKDKILQSLAPLEKKDFVDRIYINQTPRRNGKKGIQSVIVELKLKGEEALNHFPEIRRLIVSPAGMKTYVDGETATLYDIQRATKQDMAHS